MKKIAILTLSLLSFLCANAQTYSTTAPTGQTIYYVLYSGKAMLTYPGSVSYNPYAGYAKPTGYLVIPDSVTRYGIKYPITSIGSHALSYCDSLFSVTIPNTVKEIYDWAFSFDYALDSVFMLNNVTEIGEHAFASCNSLTYINMPDSVTTIGNSAFSDCSSLSSITIPSKVSSIGNNAFSYCSSLTHIYLQADSLIVAGNNNNPIFGIEGNASLSNVEIDSNVKVLPPYIFKGCTGINSITIPKTIKNIGTNAFAGCVNLTMVNFNADSCESMLYAFSGCTNLTTLTIGNNVRAIPNHAFVGCAGITTVNCPLSLKYIGNMSFQNCTGLSTFICPSTVEYIGSGAFYNCANLTRFDIPNISLIHDNTFKGCASLSDIIIPNTVLTIGNGAFEGCSNLDSLSVPTSVNRIKWRAFAFCNNLTYVSLPHSIDSISCGAFGYCGELAQIDYNISDAIVTDINAYESGSSIRYPSIFCGCNNLTSINFGDSVRNIPAHSFSYSGISNVSLPDSVLSISDYAFHKCDSLKSVILPNSLSYIGLFAFDSCASLDTVVMGNSVIEINWYAFKDCSSLRFVNMSPTLTIIGNHAFNGCFGLESIVIPSSVTSIGEGAFANCYNLDEIYVLPVTPPSGCYENDISYYTNPGNPCPSFYSTHNHAVFHIPCGTTTAYQSSWYYNYSYSEPTVEYTYTVNSSDTLLGNAGVIRDIRCQDSSIVIYATLTDTHYHFSHWSNGNLANPDTLYLTSDSTITAFFERNQYTVTANSNDSTMGFVSGSNTYFYQDTALLTASPFEHYHFVQWSDGNTDNPRQYIINDNITLTATFAIDTHNVSVSTNNIAYGGVEGGGDFAYGTPCTVSATAYTGYVFSRWSNGITANPYTFAVLEDTELMAIFEEEGTQGIDYVADKDNIRIFSKYDRILIDGLNGQDVTIYTIDGRVIASLPKATEHVAIPVTNTGVYIVKIGNHPARKVVVIR